MQTPKSIMMWRATEKLTSILSTEYLLGGSIGASLWALGDKDFEQESANLAPGSMILLFGTNDKSNYIIGGAYLLGWRECSLKEAWELYGVHNGAYNYRDFVSEVEARGGNEQSNLSMALLAHTFIFDVADYVHIPDELSDFLSDKHVFTLSLDEPLGRYLHTRVLEHRNNYIGSDGADWKGMYYAASHRNSKAYVAEFSSRVLNAYDFRCALSGVKARPVLAVAHIQPFYDSKFQKSSNGVVLRSDLYQLFSAGYITFVYKDNGDKLVAKVSQTVKAAYGDDYMQYDGKELLLPADRDNWPEPRYVLWHNQNCFENWLHIRGTHNFDQATKVSK